MKALYLNKKFKFFIAALILLLSFTSCQSTPTESIVISKDSTEQMIYDSANKADIQFGYDVPEHVTDTFTIKEGSLDINIDANVYMPDINCVPVAKIASDAITQKRADELLEYFMQDGILVTSKVWTKSDYDELIIEAKKGYLVDGEYVSDERSEEMLNYLLEKREEAPDEDIPTEITDYSIFQENELQGRIMIDDEELGYLRITENEIIFSKSVTYWRAAEKYNDMMGNEYDMPQKEIDYTVDEAISAAQTFFADLNIENMGVVDWDKVYYGKGEAYGCEIDYGGYRMVFMRGFGGMMPLLMEGASMKKHDNFDYLPPVEAEQIQVVVNEYGEVTSFHWMSPIKIIETLTEHVDILPFDEIMERFEEFSKIHFAYLDEFEQSNLLTKDVYEIKFGLNYLPLKNNSEEFMYAPCWFFVYKDCWQYTDEQLEEMESIGMTYRDWDEKSDDFFIFSAVDGASVSVYTQKDFDAMMERIPSTTATPTD